MEYLRGKTKEIIAKTWSGESGSSSSSNEVGEKFEYTDQQKAQQVLNKFKELGGNTKLENADVIFLGETHIYEHHKQNMLFINAFAKEGDIILVEARGNDGEGNTQKLDKNVLENKATERKGELIQLSKDMNIFGWDNMPQYKGCLSAMSRIQSYEAERLQTKSSSQKNNLTQLIESNKRLYRSNVDSRNRMLIKSFNEKRKQYPDNRIFIIAGIGHYSSEVITALAQYKYIAMQPKYEPTQADLNVHMERIARTISKQSK